MAEDHHKLHSRAYELYNITIKVNKFAMPHCSQQLLVCINKAFARRPDDYHE